MITEFTASQLHAKAVHDRLMGHPVRRVPIGLIFRKVSERAQRRQDVGRPKLFSDSQPPELVFIKNEKNLFGWRLIVAEVAEKHGVCSSDILSHYRDRHIVIARDEACWRIRHETSSSYPQIGRKFSKDHSSVIAAVARHKSRMEALAQERT